MYELQKSRSMFYIVALQTDGQNNYMRGMCREIFFVLFLLVKKNIYKGAHFFHSLALVGRKGALTLRGPTYPNLKNVSVFLWSMRKNGKPLNTHFRGHISFFTSRSPFTSFLLHVNCYNFQESLTV